MLSLCSRAIVSCVAVAEAAIVWPTLTGVRARGGRSCEGIFIFARLFGILNYSPVERSGAQLAPQPPPCSRVTAAALPAGAPSSGAVPGVPARRWARFSRMCRRPRGGGGGHMKTRNCHVYFGRGHVRL